MISPKKPAATQLAPAMTLVNARIPEALVRAAKDLAEADESTLTDFVRDALDNEVSRRTLCKPARPVSLADLDVRLQQMHDSLASQGAQSRLIDAKLELVLQAMGVKPE